MKTLNIYRRTRRDKARAAFTLLEVTLALGMSMIIMFVAAYSVKQTGSVVGQCNALLEVFTTGRTAMDMMERDLTGAFLDPNGNLFRGTDHPSVANKLVLWSTPTAAHDSAGQPLAGSYIYYYVDDANALVRYDVPVDSPVTAFPNADRKTLMYGVKELRVEYYDRLVDPSEPNANPWVVSWDSQSAIAAAPHQHRRLPELVRIVLVLVDRQGFLARRDQNPMRMERIIEVGTEAPPQ